MRKRLKVLERLFVHCKIEFMFVYVLIKIIFINLKYYLSYKNKIIITLYMKIDMRNMNSWSLAKKL